MASMFKVSYRRRLPNLRLLPKLLSEGKTVKEVHDEDPGFFMMNKRKIEEYAQWVKVHKSAVKLQEWKEFADADIADLDTEADRQIAIWLNLNVKKPRSLRQEQLYIYGPPKWENPH